MIYSRVGEIPVCEGWGPAVGVEETKANVDHLPAKLPRWEQPVHNLHIGKGLGLRLTGSGFRGLGYRDTSLIRNAPASSTTVRP